MDTVPHEPWTVERFLAWEDGQEGKHEFDGRRVCAMTGGSRAHQRIVVNLVVLLMARLPPSLDAVQEMRVRVGPKVRYPDVCVCAGPIPPATRTLTDSVAIFEVLSDDTAANDRESKRHDYAELPSLRYYVLVEQDRAGLTIYRRAAAGWDRFTISAGTLSLDEIGVDLAIGDIYAGLRWI